MTLLEVLVATSLMVIISVISYTGLNGLIDAKAHTDAVADRLNREVLTSRQLHKDIKSIIQREIKLVSGETRSALLGSYYSFEFSSNGHSNPLKQNRSELQRVRWMYANGELIRGSLEYLETGSQPRWKERVYLTDLTDFSLTYLNNAGQKLRKWPENSINALPKVIQINIVFKDTTSLHLHLNLNGAIQ
jgi:type II secretion system protein J